MFGNAVNPLSVLEPADLVRVRREVTERRILEQARALHTRIMEAASADSDACIAAWIGRRIYPDNIRILRRRGFRFFSLVMQVTGRAMPVEHTIVYWGNSADPQCDILDSKYSFWLDSTKLVSPGPPPSADGKDDATINTSITALYWTLTALTELS